MKGQTDLQAILRTLDPRLNKGEYVFVAMESVDGIDMEKIVAFFREQEGITLIMERRHADQLNLSYDLVCAWITLTVHSSLEAVGLTACFAAALSASNISCNVVAAFYHDHIFVPVRDAQSALEVLQGLSSRQL